MNIISFLSYILITIFTPGPYTIMSMINGQKYGFKKCLPFCMGITIGAFILMTISAIFSSILYSYIPKINFILKIIGAIYILFLALKIYKSTYDNDKQGNLTSSLKSGLLLQAVNVKAIIFAITVMSTFVVPNYNGFYTFLIILFLTVVNLCSTLAWTLFGSSFQKVFKTHTKTINTVLALLLVYCAISLFI